MGKQTVSESTHIYICTIVITIIMIHASASHRKWCERTKEQKKNEKNEARLASQLRRHLLYLHSTMVEW